MLEHPRSRAGLLPVTLIGLLLAGCLFGGSALRPAEETLIPQISDDGTKFFVLERRYTGAPEEQSDDIGRSRRQPAPTMPEVRPRVEEVLEQTGYCRQGYFELYREQRRDALRVHGECREGATAQDRQRFAGQTLQITDTD